MEIRVYYEDTDVGGVVYHANYLKFIERARSQLFFDAGMSPHGEAGFFVVRRVEAEYNAPARLGEVLEVHSRIEELKGASCILTQWIEREGTELFRARLTLAFLSPEYRPARIPTEMREVLLGSFP